MNPPTKRSWQSIALLLIVGSGLFALGWLHARYLSHDWPFASVASKSVEADAEDGHAHEESHEHAGHEHGHSDANSLELSESAMKNLGLTEKFLEPIELSSFQRSIAVPAIVVDRPGRTRLPVSAVMTGIVTHVHAVSGEAVEPGDLLLELRLTHEDLVTAQKDFLQSLGDRDVELKEIARIEGLTNSGAISTKTLLERQYSRDKTESLLRSQREALRLHGLSSSQIEKIEAERRLLTEMRVVAPSPDDHSAMEMELTREPIPGAQQQADSRRPSRSNPFRVASAQEPAVTNASAGNQTQGIEAEKPILIIQDLQVQKGQIVNSGDLLCTLADYDELLIEGQAFEAEAGLIARAKIAKWLVSATADMNGESTRIDNLELGWINNEIDPATRTMKFFVLLPNSVLEDARNTGAQRHVAWKYRVGQRMQLHVPVEVWEEQIVLPVDAVVQEGIDSFVFQQNGDHFERLAVHEKYRDSSFVVVENDGVLFPGDVVARRGAHQMQMALKSKSGGAVDPHAGHNH